MAMAQGLFRDSYPGRFWQSPFRSLLLPFFSIFERGGRKSSSHKSPESAAGPTPRYLILNSSVLEFAISFPSAFNAVTFHLSGLPEIMTAFMSELDAR